jgi:hypothetical protein
MIRGTPRGPVPPTSAPSTPTTRSSLRWRRVYCETLTGDIAAFPYLDSKAASEGSWLLLSSDYTIVLYALSWVMSVTQELRDGAYNGTPTSTDPRGRLFPLGCDEASGTVRHGRGRSTRGNNRD